MTHKPPLEFSKVEALRKHMLLTSLDMAGLLGVTRMTYYGWVRGKPMRPTNDEAVRVMLRKLLAVMTEHGWPTAEVIAATRKQRMERLRELIN
jgi:DNA-binding XRE family transcriptional regulator